MKETLASAGDPSKCPIALIIRNNKILLGHRHYSLDSHKDLSVWTCPGGRCFEGETIENTLKREVEEETGINDLIVEKYLGEYPGANKGDLVPVFLCATNQTEKNIEVDKFSEWKWFSKEEFPNHFINQDIAKLINDIL